MTDEHPGVAATIWQRLRRRKLATWTAAYVTTAAALFGTLESVGDVFAWAPGVMRAVFFLLATGLCVTLILAWFHGEQGRQRITSGEAGLLTMAVACGVAGAAYAYLRAGPDDSAAADPDQPTLVVRPFTDASPGGNQAYLGIGIAEEIRRALSVRDGVPVPRASSEGTRAAHVLDGSVERREEAFRVTARLADQAGGPVWEETYEVPAAQLLDVERQIVDAVAARIGGASRGDLPTPAAIDPAAHDAYLRGEHALAQRTPASIIQAIAQYRTASSRSPEFAAALAREAYSYALFLDWGWTYPGLNEAELAERGTELSARALAEDSLCAEAWLARAYLTQLANPLDPASALPAYSRAVELDPANPEAQHQFGQTLMELGRYAEAKSAYHATLAIDGDRPMTLVPLSAIAHREGDEVAARRWADSAVALADSAPYPWASRGMLRLEFDDPAGAADDAERALLIDPSFELPARSTLAAARWALGDRARAEQELERARRALVHPERPSPTEVYYLAAALLRMNRRSDALDLIAAARPRSPWLWFYLEAPTFDPIRHDPRMVAVIDEALAVRHGSMASGP